MNELKESWRRQAFVFTNEQQKRYDELLVLRRKRVKQMFKEDRVHKGGASNK